MLSCIFCILKKRCKDPQVPEGFSGKHIFTIDEKVMANYALNPDQRRDILGEKGLEGPDRSIFAYIPLKEQQKLDQYISKAKQTSKINIPYISKEIEHSALGGFMSFGTDLSKQQKYKLYLKVMAEESKDSLVIFVFF